VNTVIGTPIDATTAYANASLQDLVATLKSAGESAATAPGHPRFADMRVYGIAIDFDQFASDQHTLQTDVKNIGTSWNLSPVQLQQSVDAGKILLRQHPCYQRLLLDLKVLPASANEAMARRYCPFAGDDNS
jgi:hypothetical protein